jgi:hypothetical protein
MILLTDYVYSFVIFYYGILQSSSQISCLASTPYNTTFGTTTTNATYTGFGTSLNCTANGFLVGNVNAGSICL